MYPCLKNRYTLLSFDEMFLENTTFFLLSRKLFSMKSQNNLCCSNYNFFHVTWVNDLLKLPEKAASLSVIGVKSLYILRQILGGTFGSVSED